MRLNMNFEEVVLTDMNNVDFTLSEKSVDHCGICGVIADGKNNVINEVFITCGEDNEDRVSLHWRSCGCIFQIAFDNELERDTFYLLASGEDGPRKDKTIRRA